jgi:uncharacterized protein DUF4255/carboxypeptidase family protein
MFEDLDATLKAMLSDAAAPSDLRNADVSFVTPDKDYKPGQATVNLFLHDVAENRQLRDNAPARELAGSTYSVRQPALRVDCTYLTTAWSANTAGLKTRDEHRLLGQALTWLSRFQVIEERFLQGVLKTPPQPYPLPMSIAQVKEGQSMGQFWSALGVPPRPAFSVTVTVAATPFDKVETYPAVEEILVESTLLANPMLAGRVLDHNLAPVPAAKVIVEGTNRQVTVGPTGAFSFEGLQFGHYTLRVQVANHADVQAAIDYAATGQIHNVILPGP